MKVIIDGMMHMYKGWNIPLSTSKGELVGSVFAYIRLLLDYKKRFGVKPVVAWEGGNLERKKGNDDYKKDRSFDERMVHQIPIVQNVCSLLNVQQYNSPGWEADDVMYTLAKVEEKQGREAIIVTADSDLYQVINDKIRLFNPFTLKYIDSTDVFTKLGIFPNKVAFLKAVVGDSSDNIIGVKRLSRKHVNEMIGKFNSPEHMYEFSSSIPEKIKDKVIENKELVLKNYKLSQLYNVDLTSFPLYFDSGTLYNILEQLEFKSYITRFDELVRFATEE